MQPKTINKITQWKFFDKLFKEIVFQMHFLMFITKHIITPNKSKKKHSRYGFINGREKDFEQIFNHSLVVSNIKQFFTNDN